MPNPDLNAKVARSTASGQRQHAADARKAALVKHAREQIAQHGLHNASLNEIIRLAGGSKATLVKYFGGKSGLFAAALEETVREAMSPIILDNRVAARTSIEQGVTQLVVQVLQFYLLPECLSAYRGVIAIGRGEVGLARTFYESGHMTIVAEIAGHLACWKGAGIREDLDCRAAAGHLVHMARSGLYERALMGLQTPPFSASEIGAAAESVAHLFVNGIVAR